MDFAAWQQHLVAGLGHEATIPWHEPCRLDPLRQQALGRFARRSGWLMGLGAVWYDKLADGAESPTEEAVLRLVARAYTGHASTLRRLSERLGGPGGDVRLPPTLPLIPGLGRAEHLTVLHGAEVFARVWNQALVDAVVHDRLTSSVFAAMLYERAFLLAYARERLTAIGRQGGAARLQVTVAHAAALPLMLAGGWGLMGKDFSLITNLDWAATLRQCHRVYEQTYFGDLAYLRRRATLRLFSLLPL